MAKLRCKKCNYKFEAKDEDTCPYCGSYKGLEEEKSASALVEEVEDMLED